jgi:malate dehydrogenase (oxaloacetate-decarboxylating)(NADP+)
MPEATARQRCWFIDSRGLVVAGRANLADYKLPYAHPHAPAAGLLEAVEALHPTAIVGVSATAGSFTEPAVRAMARLNQRPIIFPLSNPTSKSECTAEQAYAWSDGRAVFASGSPFPSVTHAGKTYVPRQGNNAYIFPGVGLGVIVSKASRVTDTMFYAAARALALQVTQASLEAGSLFPPLPEIRKVSVEIATAVAEVAYEEGLAKAPRPADLRAAVRKQMYDATYPVYAK